MNNLKITVLDDNRDENKKLSQRNSFSLYIEYKDKKILFDTGSDNTFIKNANDLNIDLNNLDCVIISHGHYDHGDGLTCLNNKKVYVGKKIFTKRYSKRRNGISSALSYGKEIKKNHKIITVKNKKKIFDDCIIFKTNTRPLEFENNNYPTYLKNGKDDIVKDEISLAIQTPNGLIVISGCSHAGICNIVQNAKRICKTQKVLAVIGGFHLTNKTDRAEQVVLQLKKLGVENCYTGHCISNQCAEIICKHLPKTIILHTQLSFQL